MEWINDIIQQLDFNQIGSVFIALFAVIDIIGAIPIIFNLKQAGQKIEPFKTVLFSAIILIGFLFLVSGCLPSLASIYRALRQQVPSSYFFSPLR